MAARGGPRPPSPVPCDCRWDERFGEWQENRWLTQERQFKNGPFRHFKFNAKLDPEATGCRLVFAAEVECAGALGFLAKLSGQLDREFDKRVAAIEKLAAEANMPDQILGASAHEAATPAGQRRLDALIADLARDPASHGLAPKLAAYLQQAPGVTLRGIRPLTLGAALARAADRHGGALSRRAASRHSGDGLGFAVPALPRRQIAGRAAARIAARRALLVMQYRLHARFHPQRRAHLSSRAVVSSAAGGRAVHARPSLHAARQAAGRGGGAGEQKLCAEFAARRLSLSHRRGRRRSRCRYRRRRHHPAGHGERCRYFACAERPCGRARRAQRHRPAAVLRRREPQLGPGRFDRRAGHRHAGVPAALPRAVVASRRRRRNRPRRDHVHRPARLDQSSTTISATPPPTAWCAIISPSCRSGCSATTASSSKPSATR